MLIMLSYVDYVEITWNQKNSDLNIWGMVRASILDREHSRDADSWWLDRNGLGTLILSTRPAPKKDGIKQRNLWGFQKKRELFEHFSHLLPKNGEENHGQ